MSIRNDLVLINSRSAIVPISEESRKERIPLASGDRYVVTFDNSGANQAVFTIPEFPANYQTGSLSLEIIGFMESATSGNVVLNAYVEAITPEDALDLEASTSFDSVNTATTNVPATVGYLFASTITLTNADSIQSGDHVRIKIIRDVGTATGEYRLLSIKIYENLTTLNFSSATNVSFSALSATGVITSTVTTGTAPFVVASTTVVTNLNAETVDGLHATSFPILAPTASSRNVIQPTNAAYIPLVCKGFTSQTANLQQWQNSSASVLASVSAAGLITGLSFTSTQTTGTAPFVVSSTTVVTNLNADTVDGLNATSFPILAPTASSRNVIQPTNATYVPLTSRGFTAQSANLQEWQNSSSSVLASVSAAGLITGLSFTSTQTTGTAPFVVSSTTVVTNLNADTVDGLNGSDFPILSPTSSSRNVITPTDAAYVPLTVKGAAAQSANYFEVKDSSNVVQFAVSPSSYSLTLANSNLTINGINGGAMTLPTSYTFQAGGYARWTQINPTITTNTAAGIPLMVKGATSQSGNLQEWQDSAGTVLSSISSSGYYSNGTTQIQLYSSGLIQIDAAQNICIGAEAGNIALRIAASIAWSTDAFNTTADVALNRSGAGILTLSNNSSGNGSLICGAYSASTVGLTVKGAAAQTAKIQEWQNSSATVLASINKNGVLNDTTRKTFTSTSNACTFDCDVSRKQSIVLTESTTLTVSNAVDGTSYILRVSQGGSGSYTITWPATFKWPGGTAPTLSTGVGDVDSVIFQWDDDLDIYLCQSALDFS